MQNISNSSQRCNRDCLEPDSGRLFHIHYGVEDYIILPQKNKMKSRIEQISGTAADEENNKIKNLINAWGGKRYYSLDSYLKRTFGKKIYKLSLSLGTTCPNRDGKLGTGGCIFCSEGGSGDFSSSASLTICEQIEEAKKKVVAKLSGSNKKHTDAFSAKNAEAPCSAAFSAAFSAKKPEAPCYIAYFQSFTNTYGPLSYLEKKYLEAVNHPDICAVSIGTRPDCIDSEVIDVLKKINSIKPVWIELGLQTIHERTASFIRRGYELPVYEKAVKLLNDSGINVITHVILGLPGETKEEMLETVRYVGKSGSSGIKLQLMHILKGTALGEMYESDASLRSSLAINTLEEYTDIVISAVEILPPDMVIHRITGDGPKNILISPLWSGNKKLVLNTINKAFCDRSTYQGKNYNI